MTPASPTTALRELLAANQSQLHARIDAAAQGAGRPSEAVSLIAVTKSVPPAVASVLFALGETDLAENRLEPLDAKLAAWPPPPGPQPTWHFIGHIQRNKARRVLERCQVIHSIDSLRLLRHTARIATELELRRGIYLQVKLAADEAKHGLARADLAEAVEVAQACPALQLLGLMTMAPLCPGADDAARRRAASATFDEARALAERWPELELGLSMGMTGDFEEAIAAGSTAVRVGSALFRGLDEINSHG